MSLFFNNLVLRAVRAAVVCVMVAWICGAVGMKPLLAGNLSYNVSLSEDVNVLNDPNNSLVKMMAAWQTAHSLAVERMNPFVQIINTSSNPLAELTDFTFALGSTKAPLYSFDYAKLIKTSDSSITYTVDAPLTATPMAGVANQITFHFHNLTPGKSVQFQTGIVTDAGNSNMFPDYRTVLFDMNGSNAADNVMNSANFKVGGISTMVSGNLPDWVNLMPTNVGLNGAVTHGMDAVMSFPTDFTGNTVAAPEPSSIVMAMMGGLGMLFYGVRRKRTANYLLAEASRPRSC